MEHRAPLHLIDAGQQRENLAVDCVVNLSWNIHSRWFVSLGVDPVHHWCLIRPSLRGVHPALASVEVDLIFGNIGHQDWLPSLDHLVAAEAKCWARRWEDLEPWNQGQPPESNLWGQVERNREVGFDRIAGLDIICTEPGNDYWEALRAAHAIGSFEASWLRIEAERGRQVGPAGYALFSFGAISWKDERMSGALMLLECWDAPSLGKHSSALEEAVRLTLETCPRPRSAPYHFVCRDAQWHVLGA